MNLPFLVLSHLLVLLLSLALFTASTTASPEPSPDPYPAVVSLPARVSHARQPRYRTATSPPGSPGSSSADDTPLPPIASTLPEVQVEHDLLPFVIVSTLDGALHAIDRDTGKVRWTLRDGVEPLVGGGVRGRGRERGEGGEDYIVEPQGGGLYVFEVAEDEEGMGEGEGETKVRKLPLSVDQLIELSPFTFPHSPSRIFTGSKQSSLLTVDLRNGQQLNCFSSFASNRSAEECICETDELLDDMDSRSRSNRDVLFVGRTDYRLTIHTPPGESINNAGNLAGMSAAERKKQSSAQEIAYSTYTPNSFDRPLAELWATMGQQDLYEDDGSKVKRMRVELRHDGAAIGVEQGTGARWSALLGSPGIAVYDILLPLSPPHANPILVPQPPPHLPSLFPRPAKPLPPHLDFLNKPPTTYIGQVPQIAMIEPAPESLPGSREKQEGATRQHQQPMTPQRPLFYALSSSKYPLINLAPPPRPGSYANGTFALSEDLPERDQLLPYLLDPAVESETAVATRGVEDVVSPSDMPTGAARIGTGQGHGWVWKFNVVGAVMLLLGSLVAILLRWKRRGQIQVSAKSGKSVSSEKEKEEANEKTPLLVKGKEKDAGKAKEQKRSVTFAEPAPSETSVKADGSTSPESPDAQTGTPKKKSTRRRVRGKKKPKNAVLSEGGGDDDNDEEGEDGSPGEASDGATAKSPSKVEKPLPELPREMSAVDLTHLTPERGEGDDKERLSISDTVIGFGSHGTVVLKGTWGSRAVAVKRLLSDFTRLASQEVKLLQASDDHPNVIRYYCQERRDNFLYIALDLCQGSLADLIEAPDRHLALASALDRKRALKEISAGLRHLHAMKIIHRDIKPQNVLVSQLKDGSLRMLVSDFGLARRLEQDQSSFAPTANNLAGSLGWRAPECIRGQVRLHDGGDRFSSSSSSSVSSLPDITEEGAVSKPGTRLTKAVDLFALGCLYFWVLMSGQHPFGEVYDRESNIVKGDAVNMAQLDILGEEGVEAKELIGDLLNMDPAKRPETGDCLVHPFFWTPAKRLAFLCDASDRFEILNLDPPEPPIVALEAKAVDVVGKDWFSRADKVFTSNLGKYRKYKGGSVRDLLRAMRNKKHHYQDLEPAAQRHFGTLPAGFLTYFTSRYPRLFLHVYAVVKDSRLRHESMFEGYFQES